MSEPRSHPSGVVIPPDPGDPNHPDSADLLGAWMPREGAWTGTAPEPPRPDNPAKEASCRD